MAAEEVEMEEEEGVVEEASDRDRRTVLHAEAVIHE